MYTVETDPKKIELNCWNDFVQKHENGNVFQSPYYFDLCRRDDLLEPKIFVVKDGSDNIRACLLAVIHKNYRGFLGTLSSRSVIIGGPLLTDKNPELLNSLLSRYLKDVAPRVIYTQIRNLFSQTLIDKELTDLGFKYTAHLNFLFDLNQNQDELWNKMSGIRRKQIRRGYNRGITVEIKDDLHEKELSSCYAILAEVYKKARLPLPDFSFFKAAVSVFCPGKLFKAFIAYFNEEIVGFRFELVYHDTIYDWYAASSHEHYDKYPNDILPWEIIKWGSASGLKTFDFGGAGQPGQHYGVRDYKEKFGGTLVNFGRFELIHKKKLMKIAKTGFSIWQYMRSK